MKIDLKELGKCIKLTRKGQDLTQEMLAEKAGVSQHYIYEIEAGRKATVSYTHLDVYKRQSVLWHLFVGQRSHCSPVLHIMDSLHHRRYEIRSLLILGWLYPVSYTHLLAFFSLFFTF